MGRDRDTLILPRTRRRLPFPASFWGRMVRSSCYARRLPPMTPHDLRHTCASMAVSAGANVLALQRMLGHTTAKVTLDVYADLFDTDLDDLASALNAACAPLESMGTSCASDARANPA